jgi:hypothetical protein
MKRALILALVALAACSKVGGGDNALPANAAPANTAAAPPAPDPLLAKIFTPDMLGARLGYLEAITGPAFKTDGHDRTYKVGACTVIVGASRGKIDNLGIVGVGPGCSFDIAQYFAGGYDHPVPPIPTFGDIRQGLGGRWSADCLALCGNAADPVVTLHYQGSHADNFNDLVAQVSVNTDPTLAAWTDWGAQLTAKYGQVYVEAGKFNAGDTLDAVATKDFAAIRPTTVRVGGKLGG